MTTDKPYDIPCFSLSRGHAALREELKQAVSRVIDSDWFILGPELQTFEREFAQFVQCDYAIGVANGLDALRISLLSLDVGAGDKVVVPAHTFIASALAVSSIGATPVLADVDERNGLISVEQLQSVDLEGVKAIMPVHLYGQACDMDSLTTFAKQHDIAVVEDTSQAHGTRYKDKLLGGHGDMSAFSLYPTKNLGALGDAGVITTNDSALYEKVRRIRNYGSEVKYRHSEQGLNSRLSEIQAAALSVKLKYLNASIAARQQVAQWYDELLSPIQELSLLDSAPGQARHLYVIRVAQREHLQAHLSAVGIETQIHYPTPIHRHQAYAALNLPMGAFPNAEAFCTSCLSLPFYPELTFDEVKIVANEIAKCYV